VFGSKPNSALVRIAAINELILTSSSFGVFLNPEFMASLDAKDRDAIMAVSGEKLSRMAGKSWDEDAKGGEQDARDSGNTIMDASAEIIADFEARTADIEAAWLESSKDRDVDAAAALMELRDVARSL